MAVTKTNGFAAPYRSLTLRNEKDALVSRNGILSISGAITSDLSNITVPPFSVIQQGMIISESSVRQVPFPAYLEAPFALTVSAPTPNNINDLTFQFGRSPFDITDNEVVLATYDGTAWSIPPMVSIEGLLRDLWQANIDLKKVGVQNGLLTKIVATNYIVESGVLIDKYGQKILFEQNMVTPILAADPQWNRVDRSVYRRETDNEKRIGIRKILLGNTYSDGTQQIHNQQIDDNLIRHSTLKTVIASDNTAHVIYAEGFGSSFNLKYQKFDETRGTLLVAESLLTGSTTENFDIDIDQDDNIHIVYASSGNINHVVIDIDGNIVYGPFIVDNTMNYCDKPTVRIDPLNTKVFILYQALVSPYVNQIFFTTRDFTGSLITSPVQITNTITNLVNPSLDVSSDLMVYVAYEAEVATTIHYMILDDIGQINTPAIIISASTGSTSFGTLTNNATGPKVRITDNKQVFVLFRQRKTLTNYGVTIWTNNTAYLPNLLTALENITAFDYVADDFMNELHLSVSRGNSIDYVKVDGLTVIMTENLGSSCYVPSVKKDKSGSLFHGFSQALSASYIDSGIPQDIDYIGPVLVSGTINDLVLNNLEMSFTTASLTHTPVVGERITIAGSTGNDGIKYVTGVRFETIEATNDTTVITVDTVFSVAENPSPGAAQFAYPAGNEVRVVKTVAELSEERALRMTELDSDILLARMKFPGPLILNYIPSGGSPGTNSDLFGMYGPIDVDWSASTVDALTMTSGAKIVDLLTHSIYTISGGTFPMVDGDALYVVLDGATFSIAPQVSTIASLPWGLPIQVLGFVEDGEFNPHLFSVAGMGQLDVGEQIVLGQDLSKQLRARLGLLSETSYQNYTSNSVISPTDNYPAAISKLDQAVGVIVADHALEDSIPVVTPTTIITSTELEWSADNNIPDIQVYVNDRRVWLGASADYLKISINELEFNYELPENAVVGIRLERTGSGGSLGGSVDLTNITTDIAPITNGAFSVGTASKGMKKIYLKDTVTNQVYELAINNGVFEPSPV